MMITTKMGMSFVHFGPPGHQLDDAIQAICRPNAAKAGLAEILARL